MRIRNERLSRGGGEERRRRRRKEEEEAKVDQQNSPVGGGRENTSLLFIVSKLFLPLITVDDWTGQDSLAEEFPLSGRNGIQFRPVEVQRFRGSDCSLDPLESYPIIPMEESTLVFFLSFFFFSSSLHFSHSDPAYSASTVSYVIKSVEKYK